MLGTRSCFKLGHKSILYLFLAFAFNGKASDAKHTEFGCEFADEQYKVIQTDKEQPVWSDTIIKPHLGGLAELEMNEESMVNNPFIPFSEENIMNELPLFRRFYNDYLDKKKSSNGTVTLETFFNNYEVHFEPKTIKSYRTYKLRMNTDPASYLIQELQALKNLSVSPYLISAYVDPIGVEFHPDARISDNVDKLLHKRVQDHLAAVIKIKIGTRIGYLLMDPGYINDKKLLHPFIVYVMEDGKPPHGDFLAGSEKTNWRIKFTVPEGRDNAFIVAHVFSNDRYTKPVRHVLYYVQKPYCSFMENTVKANLLRIDHGIIARQSYGVEQAYLRFKIAKHFDGFCLSNLTKYSSAEVEMKFKNVTWKEEANINGHFGFPFDDANIVHTITDQLDFIRLNVLRNKAFVKQFIGLAIKLGLAEREKSGIESFIFRCFGTASSSVRV